MSTSHCDDFEMCKLTLEYPVNLSVIIKSAWRESSFSIILFDGKNTWNGQMNSEAMALLSGQLGLTLQEYTLQCRSAFSGSGNDSDFIYIFKDSILQWKKQSLDMKITFGQLCMKKTPVVDTLVNIIEDMLTENALLKKKLNRIEREKINLMTDNNHLIETLEDCNKLKNKMENDLFKQFLTILNTKKEKIRELKKLSNFKSKKETNTVLDNYECDTDVDSDSDDVGDEEEEANAGSGSEVENSRVSDKEPDLDEKFNQPLLLPRRNRTVVTKPVSSSQTIEVKEGLEPNSSEGQVPQKHSTISKSSHSIYKGVRNSAVSFVDGDNDFEENVSSFPSNSKRYPTPEISQESVIHSPENHKLSTNKEFRRKSENEWKEASPNAKVSKIEKSSVSDKRNFVNNDSNNYQQSTTNTSISNENNELTINLEDNCNQKADSVKDLIDKLFS